MSGENAVKCGVEFSSGKIKLKQEDGAPMFPVFMEG